MREKVKKKRTYYRFKVGDLVESTKGNIFLIQEKGPIPDRMSFPKGYKVLNLISKANYWTPVKDAHKRWKFKAHSKSGLILYGTK